MTGISDSTITTPIKEHISENNTRYKASIVSSSDYTLSGIEKAKKNLDSIISQLKALGLQLDKVRIYDDGIHVQNNNGAWVKYETKDVNQQRSLKEAEKKIKILWKALKKNEVRLNVPDREKIINNQNKPAEPYTGTFTENGNTKTIKATFTFNQVTNPLFNRHNNTFGIRTKRLEGENDASYVRRILRDLVEDSGKRFDIKKQKIKDSILGLANSIVPRKHYTATITLPNGQEVSSTEEWDFNGNEDGAVASSFHRYADADGRVTLMRALTNEKNEIDCFSGRVSEKTAQQMAEFLFLKHHQTHPDKYQGTGPHTFTFATQSLLPFSRFNFLEQKSRKMNLEEIKAYEKLRNAHGAKSNNPLKVNIDGEGNFVAVYFDPIPVAISQFNHWGTAEYLLPKWLSGRPESREQTQKCDQELLNKAKNLRHQTEELKATIRYLENASALDPYQEIMVRAYLCKLLDIPLVTHCKSSVDRTNIVNAMIVSMNMMLRTNQFTLTAENGYAVFKMTETPLFKELVAINLIKGEKNAEFSRHNQGYKYLWSFLQNPALQKILPERILKKEKLALRLFALTFIILILIISMIADLIRTIIQIGKWPFGKQSPIEKKDSIIKNLGSLEVLKLARKIWNWQIVKTTKGAIDLNGTQYQFLTSKHHDD